MKCQDIMNAMAQIAPKGLMEDWDNVGLLVGNPQQDVSRVLVCLDATEDAVDKAIELKCDMLVSHHPVIFSGMKKLRTDLYAGHLMQKLLMNNLSVFSAHTNYDMAEGGINDTLAEILGLEKVKHWTVGNNDLCGRIGYVPEKISIEDFAQQVCVKLGAEHIRYVKAGDKKIKKVAVCGGAGSGQIEQAALLGVDAYVTSDVKYHDGQRAQELGIHLIDGGHFHTERHGMKKMISQLESELADKGKPEFLYFDDAKDVFKAVLSENS